MHTVQKGFVQDVDSSSSSTALRAPKSDYGRIHKVSFDKGSGISIITWKGEKFMENVD
jgi:hypothetical protein